MCVIRALNAIMRFAQHRSAGHALSAYVTDHSYVPQAKHHHVHRSRMVARNWLFSHIRGAHAQNVAVSLFYLEYYSDVTFASSLFIPPNKQTRSFLPSSSPISRYSSNLYRIHFSLIYLFNSMRFLFFFF